MNIAKLEKLKQWILDEPRRYRQERWLYAPDSIVVRMQKPPCGTAACLAGSACLMEGYTPIFPEGVTAGYAVKSSDGTLFDVEQLATGILGLTEEQSAGLAVARFGSMSFIHVRCPARPRRTR